MTVIIPSGRRALIDYKYQSTLKGWLDSNIMNDFWERVVSFCPLWLAPNVITFAATLQFIFSAVIFSVYCTDLARCVDAWLYYMLAASLFIYQTLDAIDGKQARRTKQSSPLGQLFDHGNDALILTPIVVTGYCTAQYGTTWSFLTCLMIAYSIFFMINFRARHEGMMHFGFFSVTEFQLVGIGIYLLAAILGCDIWQLSVFGIIDFRDLLNGFLVVVGVFTVYSEYQQVQRYYARNPQKKDPGQIYEILHMMLFVAAFTSWNLVGILQHYTWTYLWIAGFVFCGMIHRLIVAEVTHMPSFKHYHLLNVLFVIVIGSLYEFLASVPSDKSIMLSPLMVYGVLLYVLLFWGAFVLKVIDEICDTLQIRLFVINPPKIQNKAQ